MRTVTRALVVAAAVAPTAAAADGTSSGGIGLLTGIFLAFGAAIVLLQFVPALALFGSMIYGLFASARRRTAPAEESRERA